ncbi:MAG: hypothetical protein E7101_02135 [Prevotella ruminicola]|jgi:hypothetical protein|uniref:Caspase family p20 domain-containing protein n=1 Tax=Xylanibacter ruminicola TaxID=839 RepID=A0A9D5S754_XYLRU|nr:hypothetical protein [Xylanibacter ruminicola]
MAEAYMDKIILLLLLVFYASFSDAQIKTQREYDYVGTETNNAGLRIVGIKELSYTWKGGQKEYIEYYGCIDENGQEVIPVVYKKIELNKEWNYIKIQKYGGIQKHNGTSLDAVGLLTEDGRRAILSADYYAIPIAPRIYKKLKCTIVIRYNVNNDYYHSGVINNMGRMMIPPIYDSLCWIDEDNGILAAKLNGKWGVIDYNGKEILSHKYEEMEGCNGFVLVGKDNKKALIDVRGNVIINFNTYDYMCNFNGWSLWAKKSNKYALLDNKGNIIIPFKNYGKNVSVQDWNIDAKMITYHKKSQKSRWVFFDDLGHQYNNQEEANNANERLRKKGDTIINELATFTWLNLISNSQQLLYELRVGVKSDSKIENVTVTINGKPDRGIKSVENDVYAMTIKKNITLSEGENVIRVTVTNAAGTAQEEKTIVYRPQGGELPSIEWLDFAATANKKEYQMRLGIKSKSKVEEVNVTVNGALTRGIKTVASDGYDLTVDRTLALSEGLNRIVVSVRNGDGISTSEKVITYQGNNPTPVFNDKRIAFVIGNSHYSNSEMNLANPENDAKDVAEKLKGLGFEVVLKLDATLEDMDRELTSFGQKAKEYDVAMFYYAGHGIQSKGVNYLIPTNIDNLAEDNMKYKCVDMERVLDVMEDSKCKLKIVILDACRNDPLSRRWHRSAGTRGLSLMNAPIGTIISFSTAPGSTALDGKGRNSPYTEAFLNTLDMPNLDVFHFFQKVGASVLDKTQRSQNPWLSVSFTGDFYFNKQ